MKQGYFGGRSRDFDRTESFDGPRGLLGHDPLADEADPLRGRRRGPRSEGRGGRGRAFVYGQMRLALLAMIAEAPRHGYELIKAIEDRFGGGYTPSPGVIYPTLAWLDDMGFATVEADASNRKLYRITEAGADWLKGNKAELEALQARMAARGDAYRGPPAPLLRAMENLKTALRLRLRQGPLDDATAEKIADAIDETAKKVERS